jgi:hypothetical protein
MTRLRSTATDAVGTVLLVIGFVGFIVCWQIGWSAQERILMTDRFDHPTAATPSPIEMKGRTFFVEPSYARRFRLADNLILPSGGIAAVGMGLQKRKRIGAWWKQRRVHPGRMGFLSIQPSVAEAPKRDEWSLVSLGVIVCFGLFQFWGVIPAFVCALGVALALIGAWLSKRT